MGKNRGKKYNPHKNAALIAQAEDKATRLFLVNQAKKLNLGVMYVEGMNQNRNAQIIDMNDLSIYNPNSKVAALFAAIPHHWYHTLFTACRDQTGKEYIVTFNPVFYDDTGNEYSPLLGTNEIAAYLEDKHKDFNKKSINPLHIITTGWITFTYPREVDEEIIDRIISKLGLWDYSTKWEYEKQNSKENPS